MYIVECMEDVFGREVKLSGEGAEVMKRSGLTEDSGARIAC